MKTYRPYSPEQSYLLPHLRASGCRRGIWSSRRPAKRLPFGQGVGNGQEPVVEIRPVWDHEDFAPP